MIVRKTVANLDNSCSLSGHFRPARPTVCAILPIMRLSLAHIGSRLAPGDEFDRLTIRYLRANRGLLPLSRPRPSAPKRLSSSGSTAVQGVHPRLLFSSTAADARCPSEAFAAWLAQRRDQGAQHIVFAVGPASGWSDSRPRAGSAPALPRAPYSGSCPRPPRARRAALPRLHHPGRTSVSLWPLSDRVNSSGSAQFSSDLGHCAARQNCWP